MNEMKNNEKLETAELENVAGGFLPDDDYEAAIDYINEVYTKDRARADRLNDQLLEYDYMDKEFSLNEFLKAVGER